VSYQVRVDKDLCMSSGRCVADHPRAFRFDDDEIAETTETVNEVADEALLEAARDCPAEAILVLDDSGEQLAP
jgi:ferredoxin